MRSLRNEGEGMRSIDLSSISGGNEDDRQLRTSRRTSRRDPPTPRPRASPCGARAGPSGPRSRATSGPPSRTASSVRRACPKDISRASRRRSLRCVRPHSIGVVSQQLASAWSESSCFSDRDRHGDVVALQQTGTAPRSYEPGIRLRSRDQRRNAVEAMARASQPALERARPATAR